MHEEPLMCAAAWQASVEWCMQGGHSLWAIPRGHLEILVRTDPDLSPVTILKNLRRSINLLIVKMNDSEYSDAIARSLVLIRSGAGPFRRLFHRG